MSYQPKILIAPSAYKGSLIAKQVAVAIVEGFIAQMPAAQIKSMPLADGGDSTIKAIYASLGSTIKEALITGPLGKPAIARQVAGKLTTTSKETENLL